MHRRVEDMHQKRWEKALKIDDCPVQGEYFSHLCCSGARIRVELELY